MSIKNKIGLEAEFLLFNKKGELVIPPDSWDRDGFPLLGEIRGEPADEPAIAVANFIKRKMEILSRMRKDYTMQFLASAKCPLKLYKEANRQIDYEEKGRDLGKVLNIHGVDLENFSDQILSRGKIQGIRVSCGLHVHFSSEEYSEEEYHERQYEQVLLPISPRALVKAKKPQDVLAEELLQPTIYLYRDKGYEEKKKLICRASRLNKPAIEYIVNAMDNMYFEHLAPPVADRTKFRQPGFFELKPYGFEYRSLPMTDEVEARLFEIATFAFTLLKDINKY